MTDNISWKGKTYLIRIITLFPKTPQEVTIRVGSTKLYKDIQPYLDDTENENWYEASSIDDLIGYYVPYQILFYSDKFLRKYVEREYFS